MVPPYAGQPGADIKCGIFTITSLKPKDYQALSYTWGDSLIKRTIQLNGKLFLVTPNLESALRNIGCRTAAERGKQLPIWIDAICINQDDRDERDEQVRRMKTIYQQAARFLVWLGDYNEPSDQAVLEDLCRRGVLLAIEENSEQRVKDVRELIDALLAKSENGSSLHRAPRTSRSERLSDIRTWTQLIRLFYRPWFERLWIIQELGVAQHAVALWGRIEIPWKLLGLMASMILRPKDGQIPPEIQKLLPWMGAHRMSQVAIDSMLNVDIENILTLLHNTQNTKCADPRDRLFAILGIVEDNKDIEIDYSIPTQQVYREWAYKRIMRTGSLDVLTACADSGRYGDLPSWVPDLRRPFGQNKPLWIEACLLSKGIPSRFPVSSYIKFSKCKTQLRVLGRSWGRLIRLSSVGDVTTEISDPTNLTERLQSIATEWEDFITSSIDKKISSIVPLEEYDLAKYTLQSPEISRIYDYMAWRGPLEKPSDLLVEDKVWNWNESQQTQKEFERFLFSRLYGCQMFVADSELKRVGVLAANCHAQIGDQIWELLGCRTPLVLRPLGDIKYRVVTPCYTSVLNCGLSRDWMEGMSFITLV